MSKLQKEVYKSIICMYILLFRPFRTQAPVSSAKSSGFAYSGTISFSSECECKDQHKYEQRLDEHKKVRPLCVASGSLLMLVRPKVHATSILS